MVSIKTKTFNALTTPNVNPGQPIDSVLERKARIIGVVCSVPVPAGGDSAKFGLYVEIAGIAVPIAQIDCTDVTKVQYLWAGAQGKTGSLTKAGPAVDTVTGAIPLKMVSTWTDAFNNAGVTAKIQIITAGGGQVQILYTVDNPTDDDTN